MKIQLELEVMIKDPDTNIYRNFEIVPGMAPEERRMKKEISDLIKNNLVGVVFMEEKENKDFCEERLDIKIKKIRKI